MPICTYTMLTTSMTTARQIHRANPMPIGTGMRSCSTSTPMYPTCTTIIATDLEKLLARSSIARKFNSRFQSE